MTATPSSLILIVYAPALASKDERVPAVALGLERALPGLRLAWTITDEGKIVPLLEHDSWVAEAGALEALPMLCNDDENHLVTLSGWERPVGISSGGRPQFEFHAELPLEATVISAAMDVLEGIGEGARAFWGHASPQLLAAEFARQTRHSASDPDFTERGLPSIKLPEDIPSPELPHYLGWLNYWSAAAARVLRFPDPARDADLLSRSRRTATGGWVVRLTDAPLDVDNPAHLAVLRRAYERFPEIGGRSIP
jgi:hypothetical protein